MCCLLFWKPYARPYVHTCTNCNCIFLLLLFNCGAFEFCIGIAQAHSVWVWNAYIMATFGIASFYIWNTDSLLWVHLISFDKYCSIFFIWNFRFFLRFFVELIEALIFDNSFETFIDFCIEWIQIIVVKKFTEMAYFRFKTVQREGCGDESSTRFPLFASFCVQCMIQSVIGLECIISIASIAPMQTIAICIFLTVSLLF